MSGGDKGKCTDMRKDRTISTSKTEHIDRWIEEEYLFSALLQLSVFPCFGVPVTVAVTWWWKIVTNWEKTVMQHLYYIDIIPSLINYT